MSGLETGAGLLCPGLMPLVGFGGVCHLLTEGRSAPYALIEHVLRLLSHLWQMLPA